MRRTARHRLFRLGRDQRGVAAVEFGMIAPIFLALLVGVIDVGRYMWTLNTMQYAIDQAVRAGVVQKLEVEEVTDLVKTSLAGLDPDSVTVDVESDASTLSITADTNYTFLFPISSFMSATTISLRTEMPK
ncbi:MAG TPA: TadE/TadG family type IV pilus assembly protein [Dongiaceae bacterium]|jgi:Flp pilus assembly protein TadG|nr:TadE/TadG family type IV pilus assembly protein [Dongiaceae bacterium]